MTIRGIPFSGPMVLAVLRNEKDVTRRVVVPQPPPEFDRVRVRTGEGWEWFHYEQMRDGVLESRWPPSGLRRSPYGTRGDLLYVRETWGVPDDWTIEDKDRRFVLYRASEPPGQPKYHRWRPSIHMPRWATRLWLFVEGVRAERLQMITNVDCQREGLVDLPTFSAGWDALNTGRGYSFESNPWVWRVAFSRAMAPVDFQMAEENAVAAAIDRRGR